MADVDDIVRGLTKAQRAVLMRNLHGNYTIATLEALKRKGLMRVKCADPNPETGGWRHTPLGLEVRARLLSSSGEG